MPPPTHGGQSWGCLQPIFQEQELLVFLPVGIKVRMPHPEEAQSKRGVTRGQRGFGAWHMHWRGGSALPHRTGSAWGLCRAGQAAKEGLVPPRQLRKDGLGSSQASPSALLIGNGGTSPKSGMMGGQGRHMKFRGFVQENPVMFVCSLGLQNSPSSSTPSTPTGFGGVTPFYNSTLIPLAPRKHKGNPQNN